MTARLVMIAVVALGSAPAFADAHKLLVLKSEGRVDATTRAKIDAAIVKLAAAAEPGTSAGDLNFTDAATAVGCKPDTAACKDEVLGMLSVDEIVITTVARKPGGIEIAVRRVAKGGASREAKMLLAAGTPPDKLDEIAPLFAPVTTAPAPSTTPPAPPAPPAPSIAPVAPVAPNPPPFAEPAAPPTPAAAPPRPAAPPTPAAPAEPVAIPGPARHEPLVAGTPLPAPVLPPERRGAGRNNLALVGMASGAGMVVVGMLFWSAAKSTQSDIDGAPTRTAQDLGGLRDLESRGDRYAAIGNVFAIGGLALAGVSTYIYLRDRRAASTASARIAPALLPHGAGLVLTIGATP